MFTYSVCIDDTQRMQTYNVGYTVPLLPSAVKQVLLHPWHEISLIDFLNSFTVKRTSALVTTSSLTISPQYRVQGCHYDFIFGGVLTFGWKQQGPKG